MAENQTQDRDQRTEDATPERIRKSRADGQIGFSSELLAGLMMATAVGITWTFGDRMLASVMRLTSDRLRNFEAAIVAPEMLLDHLIDDVIEIGFVIVSSIFVVVLVVLAAGLMQTGFNFSTKPLQPQLSKLSVKSGFARIFNTKSIVRGVQSVTKATLILLTMYWVARSRMTEIGLSGSGSYGELISTLGDVLLHCSAAMSLFFLIAGVADLMFQKWKHLQELKMSRKDIKDEQKESDGDPLVKARIRRLQNEMGQKRTLDEVPKATVLVTNPTHYAVALQYDRETMVAPVVIAKGADFLARKMIDVAKEHDVTVVERKPVARFLYANVEVGQPIPFELYQAVAEILNFVNQMDQPSYRASA